MNLTELLIVLSIILVGVVAVMSTKTNQHDGKKCLEYKEETIVTYPYAALQALGPQYLPLALTPSYDTQKSCVKWGNNLITTK